jgi:hypothetical protein
MSSLATLSNNVRAFIAAPRLPWRVRVYLEKKREQRLRERFDRRVLETRPFEVGKDAAHFEIHSMLGHRHVGMCLWAVKSFLFQCDQRYHVVLHEDGSLTDEDVATLKSHLPGVTLIRKAEADAAIYEWLRDYPNALAYRQALRPHSDHRHPAYNMHIFAVRLFDFNYYSTANKRMFLDADVLFFKPPREIIDWIENPADTRSMYSVEAWLPVRDSRDRLVFEPKEATFNAGLICMDSHVYSLDVLDDWIGVNKDRMNFAPTFEQSAYRHLITSEPGNVPLPNSYSFNYTDADVTATHFGIKLRFYQNIGRIQARLL